MIIKGIRRILSICAVTSLCVTAHAASLNVGYCLGEIAEEGISKVGNATVSGAIILPSEILSQYSGAAVTGVRVGLVTADGVSDLNGWIRDSLEEDDLDSGSGVASAGWNLIPLSGNVTLSGDPVVVGFSFSQQKSVKCISLVGEDHENAKWIAKNGKWEESTKTGMLSIELVIESENLPGKDLSIVSVTSPVTPVKAGSELGFDINLQNLASEYVDGFDIAYSIDNTEQNTIHMDTGLSYGEKTTARLTLDSDALTPDVAHTLTITAICEGDDVEGNNEKTIPVGTYTQSVDRRVLIEEFTTEQCGNCPRAINTLEQCHKAGYGDRMAVVAHHVGYGEDWLTREEDIANIWFYDPTGKSGTFAPAVMLDRTVLEGETVPVNSIGYFNDFEPVLQNAIDIPAFVTVSVIPEIDTEAGMLRATVSAEKLPVFDAASESPRFTVYVVEDGILHHNQAGISSDSFTHSHVFRKCMTDIWGDPVEKWESNTAEMTFSCQLESDWSIENLSVVAFIHNHDTEDISKCNVLNSAVAKADQSDVEEITESRIVRYEYYSPTGLRLDSPAEGIGIRRTVYADGSVAVTRVFTTSRD